MSDDLISRLKKLAEWEWLNDEDQTLVREASQEIKRVRERLLTLLELFDTMYVCDHCKTRGAGYMESCKNPLHRLNDAVWDERVIQNSSDRDKDGWIG